MKGSVFLVVFLFLFLSDQCHCNSKEVRCKRNVVKKTLLCVFAFKFKCIHSRCIGICVRWVNNFVLFERILQSANAFVAYNCAKNIPTFLSLDAI